MQEYANQIQGCVDEVIQLHKEGKITRCEIERETVQTENGLEYGDELLITFVIKDRSL